MKESEAKDGEWSHAEAVYRAFCEHIPVGAGIAAEPNGAVRANAALARFLGYDWREIESIKPQDVVTREPPDDLATDTEQFRRLAAGEIDSYGLEKRFVTKAVAICCCVPE